jgi:transposase
VALGYRQLINAEEAFRSLKQTLELRPVYHRLEDRIRAHVLLCWLALLLIRVAESETGRTLRAMRETLERMHAVDLSTLHGDVTQRTATIPSQKSLFAALRIPEPPLFLDVHATRKR